ncbi:MAG: hypothetical protein GEU71_17665 [Actinobacteria bacterium]|nr:hypothetical protein [Actinomycetota bacterium]
MAQVIIRNLDESVVAALKTRAAAHGHSLGQELRLVLRQATRPPRKEVARTAAAIRQMTPGPVSVDLEALIREDRDR